MLIEVPELSAIALIGEVTEEKLEFIQQHFSNEEVLDNRLMEDRLSQRLERAELTAVNIPHLQDKSYKSVLRLAKKYHCMPVAVIFKKEVGECNGRQKKPSRETDCEYFMQKGFKRVFLVKDSTTDIQMKRIKMASNKKESHGPFDIIGDVHGCYDELCELLIKLGYEVNKQEASASNKQGRKVIFLGDLVDRGPGITQVLKLVMSMVDAGQAYSVLGNHDNKLLRKLHGSRVQIAHGLEETLEQLEGESEEFIRKVTAFLEGLVSHYVLDDGKLVVVHAGLKEKLHGRESNKVRDLAIYGETTGETDEYGFPVRLNWSRDYKGKALVVYGHTPQLNARMINHTINIDTGCVYGGKLTAFKYPEGELVEVEAKRIYYASPKPLT